MTTAEKKAFLKRLFDKELRDSDKDYIYNALQKPNPARKRRYKLRHLTYKPNWLHVCDLLQLPNDKGYTHCLVIVDAGSGKIGLEPLKKMTAPAVLQAAKRIYQRTALKIPTRMNVDNGSEFKGVFRKYFTEKGVVFKTGLPYRHRAISHAERVNAIVAKALFHVQYINEKESGWTQANTEWVAYISDVENGINRRRSKEARKRSKRLYEEPGELNKGEIIVPIGTKVYRYLDAPRDSITNRVLATRGKTGFRETDLRLEKSPREIEDYIVLSGQNTIGYILSGFSRKHLFTRADFILASKVRA